MRYAIWLASAARGDFGYSLAYGGPVAPLIWERARATLLLTGTATVFAWLLAVPLGIWAAGRRAGWREGLWNALCSFLLSVPDLLWAIVFLALAVATGAYRRAG